MVYVCSLSKKEEYGHTCLSEIICNDSRENDHIQLKTQLTQCSNTLAVVEGMITGTSCNMIGKS